MGTVEVALILAAAGQVEPARAMFTAVEPEIEALVTEEIVPVVGARLGGVYAALGDSAHADTWFAGPAPGLEPDRRPDLVRHWGEVYGDQYTHMYERLLQRAEAVADNDRAVRPTPPTSRS
jgi:hypothetical protein